MGHIGIDVHRVSGTIEGQQKHAETAASVAPGTAASSELTLA
jgi:hypothetical protein